MNLKGLSLFANVGIAEALLHEINVEVVIANELIPKRIEFYKHLYPNTFMIEGDITEENIFNKVLEESKKLNIDFIIATPPCQGMSTAGKKDKNDSRNQLVTYAVEMIKKLNPKYVLLENVPEQLKTKIEYQNKKILIPDYLFEELSSLYNFNKETVINSADYGVPQNRIRTIFLLTRKDINFIWEHPKKVENILTLENAIGDLPSLDPLIYDLPYEKHLEYFPDYEKKVIEAKKVSKWHIPPHHVFRQVFAMENTPTGKSAFENIEDKFKPTTKEGKVVKGFKNTYKRQSWDKPGYTITMYNRTIGSQENVHPGRKINKNGKELFSDARVLTVFELMRVMSLPDDWDIPEFTTENFIRQVIGEGIPPKLVKSLFLELLKLIKQEKNE